MSGPNRVWLRVAVPAAALFTLLRLPSFLEPHWYTDEAGYLTAARALLRGRVLYAGIWTNKPPLHVWTLAVVARLFGTSEWGLHLLTFVAGLLVVAAVAYAGSRLLTFRRALVAGAGTAVLLGLPIFDAQLAIPESVLIAPVTWAGVLLAVRLHHGTGSSLRWPMLVGALVAVGIGYQQTALAEATAFGLVMLVARQVRRVEVLAYAATVVVLTAGWLAAAIVIAGFHSVLFALVGFYLPYTQSAMPTGGDTIGYALGLLAGGALLLMGAVCLGTRVGAWIFWVWAAAALFVPAATHLPYPHFLTPSVAPLMLALASTRFRGVVRLLNLAQPRRLLGASSLAAAALIAGTLASRAGLDFVPAAASAPWVNGSRSLSTYYAGALNVATQRSTLDEWRETFDDRVRADSDVNAWVHAHGLQGATAVVWSSDAWPYLLDDFDLELPTAPIYNDFVVLGQNGEVAQRVQQLNPDVIVTADQEMAEYGEITPFLQANYHRVYSSSPDIVWLRNDRYAAMVAAGS